MSREPLQPRTYYRHWHRVQTRWSDNDVYGHVNNTVHYQWFDTVVNSWLIDAGLLGPEAGTIIGLVVETGCRYARSLSYPQCVDVGMTVHKLGNSSVSFRLGAFAEGEEAAAAEGMLTHVYVARAKRRPVPLPAHWRLALQTLQAPSG